MEIPLKPEYGPTLGRLLAPRWHATSAFTRRAIGAAGMALVLAAGALALTLLNPIYSHGGAVPFSFAYGGLYRVSPDPGGYVKVQRRWHAGALEYSFAVDPLTLGPYSGELSAALPMYAASYAAALQRRYPRVVLRGEGATHVNTAPAYQVLYTALVEGREMYGRDVLLLPERAGAREGVAIVMLTAPGANRQVKGPLEVASTGLLLHPLKSFALG